MRVTVNDKMKEWVAAYIRAHRTEGCISIHVVFSKFNENFKATFGVDPIMIVSLMIEEGFLKGMPAKKGFSIWLPEDSGKGNGRPFRSQQKTVDAVETAVVKNEKLSAVPAENGGHKMKILKGDIIISRGFESLSHPETGEVDILKLIGYVATKLWEMFPSKPNIDGGYRVGKMNLFPCMVAAGIPREKCDPISRIMQEMAMVKKYPKSQWGVIHPSAIVYFLTPSLYNIAKDAMFWRDQRNAEIAKLRQKLVTLTGSRENEPKSERALPAVVTDVGASFEEEAIKALATAERLSEELAKVRSMLAVVENERDKLITQIREQPVAANLVKQAFNERLAAVRQAQG